jgi:protein-S-isoprenylcysteine O-methyltransferase Ste14
MAMSTPRPAPAFFRRLDAFKHWVSEDFLGGPRPLKMAWVVNLQKGGTLPFVLVLMFLWDNFSAAAWLYAAMHGSYGLIWLLKDRVLPDPAWEKRITLGGALVICLLVLGPYWLAPVLLITDVLPSRPQPSAALMGVSAFAYALGVVVMMVADAQKYFVLKLRRGLITDGMFARVRHPNYLGEMLVYGSFALLVGHWLPWLVLAWVWSVVFLTNMVMKEASMSRYPEWAAYKARTGMLLPRLLPAPPSTTSSPAMDEGEAPLDARVDSAVTRPGG